MRELTATMKFCLDEPSCLGFCSSTIMANWKRNSHTERERERERGIKFKVLTNRLYFAPKCLPPVISVVQVLYTY